MKAAPKGNKGLAKLPKAVRNKMGYMKKGGTPKKMSSGGVNVTKPKPRPKPKGGLKKTSKSTAKANKLGAQLIQRAKNLEDEDFQKAFDYIMKMVEKKKK
tara:strand:+ start:2553 stop:2852 length:300 start_codon:yes stop_codon:yes gene_type:complete